MSWVSSSMARPPGLQRAIFFYLDSSSNISYFYKSKSLVYSPVHVFSRYSHSICYRYHFEILKLYRYHFEILK
jgi:hypothetical protein